MNSSEYNSTSRQDKKKTKHSGSKTANPKTVASKVTGASKDGENKEGKTIETANKNSESTVNSESYSWIQTSASKDKNFVELAAAWDQAYKDGLKSKHLQVTGPDENQAAFIIAALSLSLFPESNKDKKTNSKNTLESSTQSTAEKAQQSAKPAFTLVLASDELQSRRLESALQAFYPAEVLTYPAREFNLTQIESTSKEAMHQRIRVITKILEPKEPKETESRPIIVTTPAALQERVPDLASLRNNFLELKLGQEIEPQDLVQKLTQMGYKNQQLSDSPGEFSKRGDIVDIIPVDKKQTQEVKPKERADFYGVRISFFDTEIDQIRLFDPDSQRQIEALDSVTIPPAQEILLSDREIPALVEKISAYAKSQAQAMYKQGANKEKVQAFRALCAYDLDHIENRLSTEVLDRWMDFIYPEKTSFLDLALELGARVAVLDVKKLQENLDAWQALKLQQISQLLMQGKTIPLVSEDIIGRTLIMQKLDRDFNVLSFSLFLEAGNAFPGSQQFFIQGRAVENYRTQPEEFYSMLKERQKEGASTYIFVGEQSKRDRLNQELLLQAPAAVNRLVPRNLDNGFEWPGAQLMILGNENVFGRRYKRSRKKRANGQTIELFSDLKTGDYVVHEDHGIGIYAGLEAVTTEAGTKDYIKIVYAKGDKLYLPMEAIEQLSKYVGVGGHKPKLSRLDSGDWNKLKTRARDSIKKLATDLVKLYATRDNIKGYKFKEDTVWDQEFAESFPYEETDDQLKAYDEIRNDMESDKVMDRLLIGDVGFGKTELAFRAMFKAVNDGKQAAMLAPTTVLAYQHYQNFSDRVKNYPVKVALLSRFASESEQKETIKELANGGVDVVIGTHRLLSQDVSFKRLGLLVVDEEQRFGVDHKESIKEKYPSVDVLSLSATPIPRTLHMSLSGIRDISFLEYGPEDRREVQTFVLEYDQAIINEAIIREISRGGQAFYLINNISKIPQIVEQLEADIPGIRVAAGHGQMPEGTLEDIVQAFIGQEYDVLVCTTIIESGIDMPNVNTLIVRDADRLGLAQLYQIKGRVGRSNRQAYAYITYDKNKALNEDAQKRLATIRDYTALGSGMKIAMRDLEVRGAGNLLGGEQHGHMESIGYELYVQMLEEEVSKIRAEQEENKLAANSQAQSEAQSGQKDYLQNQDLRLIGKKSKHENEVNLAKARKAAAADDTNSLVTPANTADTEASAADNTENNSLSTTINPKENNAKVKTVIDLKLDAYLPNSLIPSEGQRMDMYRRLIEIEDYADYQDILDELMDRYGDLPPETYMLADVSYVQSRAGKFGLERIYRQNKDIVMQFSDQVKPDIKALGILLNMDKYKHKIRFNAVGKGSLIYAGAASRMSKTMQILRQLFVDIEKQE